MSVPVLDAAAHRYSLNGKNLDSVSRIIKSVWPNKPSFDGVDPAILENARHRGERVDFWCGEYAAHNGDMDVEDRADVVESVEFFDRWWTARKPEYIAHQGKVWSEELSVCGTFDLLVNIGGTVTLIDVKRTAREEETWPIQVGAYRDLYRHMSQGPQFHISDIGVLHLHPKFAKGYLWRKYNTNDAVEWWRTTVAFYRTFKVICPEKR